MANQDAAFGFRAVRHLSGGTPRTEEYLIASGLTKVIYTGSPVMGVSTGVITLGTVSAVQHIGVFNGCFYTDPTTSKPTWKAYYPGSITASDIVANVYADPQIIFEGQHDGTATVANNIMRTMITLVQVAVQLMDNQVQKLILIPIQLLVVERSFKLELLKIPIIKT